MFNSSLNNPLGIRIVETYQNGNNWYRIWSDGWVEQGGFVYVPSSDITITFLKPFADRNYIVVAGASSNTNVVNVNQNDARTPTSTRFDMSGSNQGGALWYACGYGA